MPLDFTALGAFRLITSSASIIFSSTAGVGASVSTNAGYRQTGGKYDVYPMLVVGDKSFTTISFKSGGAGKGSKFNIYTAKPGSPESYARDPYGTTGFTSVQWYYGFLCLRPERIAVLYTVTEY